MAKKETIRDGWEEEEAFEETEELEELDEKIHRHRMGIVRRVLVAVGVVVLLGVILLLYLELRSYRSFEVQETIPRTTGIGAKYEEFSGDIISYSNDGINCMTPSGEALWNRSFEMTAPRTCKCKDYLGIYDQNGTRLYILTAAGIEQEIEVSKPIQKVCIAKQGVSAVLMKEDDVFYVRLFDRKGKEIASGEFYESSGGHPVDIALSHDATKLAVDMIDISGGKVKSTISFYNFGSVGQNEIDNNVGSYSYDNVLIPEISYVSDTRMIAIGDDRYVMFDGKEKPKESRVIEWEQEVSSVFYNEKYIGITYANRDEEDTYHIKVYHLNGSVAMENDTSVRYATISFLANNNICVQSENEAEIFTIHSIRRFYGEFEENLQYILSRDRYQDYLFVYEDRLDEVRLK